MLLTVAIALGMVVLAAVGALRGIQRGALALIATMVTGMLVTLWLPVWSAWASATFNLELPGLVNWLFTGGVFLVLALLLGYGGSVLLPQPSAGAKQAPSLVERGISGLLGLLNGALLSGYALFFAAQIVSASRFDELIAESPLAELIYRWLPWFLLVAVVGFSLLVMVRLVMRALARRAVQPGPQLAPGASAAPPVKPNPSAPPRSVAEADARLNEKIKERLGP
jgi:MFS family permease